MHMVPTFFKMIVTTLLLILLSSVLDASESVRSALKSNAQLLYNIKQKDVQSIKEMFKKGEIYSRLRSNNFYYAYATPDLSHKTQFVSAIGASFVYKSASLNGFDFNIALYGSQAYFNASRLGDIKYLKASKDLLSRYKYVNGGSTSLFAFGQANLRYKLSKTRLTIGRQLVESFYAKSNDTKMIPNTFDGVVLQTKDIPHTYLSLAYLTKQKLRDHEKSHSVLMYGDSNSTSGVNRAQWTQNDDSAMHKGLTYTALKAAGKPTDAPLILVDLKNDSISNLSQNYSSYLVPELLAQVMAEFNYKIKFDGFSLSPGVRYIQQFDNGAGAVGGASINLKGLSGYKNQNSLNSSMLGFRLVTRFDKFKINLAYTGVANKSDLVTPWRAFATNGYTRSMGVYNWRANVKSYRLELVYGANSKGIYKDGFIQTSVLYMNGDSAKDETDSMLYYLGYIKNLKSAPEFQYRVRLGYREFIGTSNIISSYLDSRFELDYLF